MDGNAGDTRSDPWGLESKFVSPYPSCLPFMGLNNDSRGLILEHGEVGADREDMFNDVLGAERRGEKKMAENWNGRKKN